MPYYLAHLQNLVFALILNEQRWQLLFVRIAGIKQLISFSFRSEYIYFFTY